MKAITLDLGLDVHKDSITIALAEPGPKGVEKGVAMLWPARLFGA